MLRALVHVISSMLPLGGSSRPHSCELIRPRGLRQLPRSWQPGLQSSCYMRLIHSQGMLVRDAGMPWACRSKAARAASTGKQYAAAGPWHTCITNSAWPDCASAHATTAAGRPASCAVVGASHAAKGARRCVGCCPAATCYGLPGPGTARCHAPGTADRDGSPPSTAWPFGRALAAVGGARGPAAGRPLFLLGRLCRVVRLQGLLSPWAVLQTARAALEGTTRDLLGVRGHHEWLPRLLHHVHCSVI